MPIHKKLKNFLKSEDTKHLKAFSVSVSFYYSQHLSIFQATDFFPRPNPLSISHCRWLFQNLTQAHEKVHYLLKSFKITIKTLNTLKRSQKLTI